MTTDKVILLVEDDAFHRELLSEALVDNGYRVAACDCGQEALAALDREAYPVALLDIRLPDVDGFFLLDQVLQRQPDCSVVMMTGQASVEAAVDAMKTGAHDYLAKPFRIDLLLMKLARLYQLKALQEENRQLRGAAGGPGMIGRSPALRHFLEQARAAALTDATVLLQGESGTGKELAAEFIHGQSSRRGGPLVRVNCGAVPETLLESEVFGHDRGAFTGADRRRRGVLEQAQGGTLLLDEIGDIPHAMQVRLLRALQEKKIRRLGGESEVAVDFRLIAATHRDLEELRESGAIREDFFFRLNVVPLWLPPLRARREDIQLLLVHFVDKYAALYARPPLRISPAVLEILQRYAFPGNVRELENLVERLQVLHAGEEIQPRHLPPGLDRSSAGGSEIVQCFRTELPLRQAVRDFERRFIDRVLAEESGNRSATARRLGISRKALWEKLAD
jgi:DNA-binding NtrC family response regulator